MKRCLRKFMFARKLGALKKSLLLACFWRQPTTVPWIWLARRAQCHKKATRSKCASLFICSTDVPFNHEIKGLNNFTSLLGLLDCVVASTAALSNRSLSLACALNDDNNSLSIQANTNQDDRRRNHETVSGGRPKGRHR